MRYSQAPFDNPIIGLAAIAEMWEGERRGADERFTMAAELVAVDGDVGVVRVQARYQDPVPHDYRDLWIMRAAHLEPAGHFVIEVGVPQLQRLPPGETVLAFDVTSTHIGFDEYEVASQSMVSHHHSLVDGSWVASSFPFRYVWPSELDLMARIAGMTLRERWSDWNRAGFTSQSTKHISVWRTPSRHGPDRSQRRRATRALPSRRSRRPTRELSGSQ